MKREAIAPRPDWQAKHKELGFDVVEAACEGPYWTEDACYRFTADQIKTLEDATQRLHDTCMDVARTIIEGGNHWERFGFDDATISYIESTWNRNDPSIMGRFDLAYDGKGEPKMLEYNADAPATLFESSVLQREWRFGQGLPDQFNFIHGQLIKSWKDVAANYRVGRLYFASDYFYPEIKKNTDYLQETATKAGLNTQAIDLTQVGWDDKGQRFVDDARKPITTMFKMYPWELMLGDEYGPLIMQDTTGFMEPAWKMVLSNKAVLSVLWDRHANHPNLVPASMTPGMVGTQYVKKPIAGGAGANISIVTDKFREQTEGVTPGNGEAVYQQYVPLPVNDGKAAVVGSWVVGGKACGIGIREDEGHITKEVSCRFIPHYFTLD